MKTPHVRFTIFSRAAMLAVFASIICMILLWTPPQVSAQEFLDIYRQFIYCLYNDGTGIYEKHAEDINELDQSASNKIVVATDPITGVSGAFHNGLWVAFLVDTSTIAACRTPHLSGGALNTISIETWSTDFEVSVPCLLTVGEQMIAAWTVNRECSGVPASVLKLSVSSDGESWSAPDQSQFHFSQTLGPPDLVIHQDYLYAAVPLGEKAHPGPIVIRKIGKIKDGDIHFLDMTEEYEIPGTSCGLFPSHGVSLFSDGTNFFAGFAKDFSCWMIRSFSIGETFIQWDGKVDELRPAGYVLCGGPRPLAPRFTQNTRNKRLYVAYQGSPKKLLVRESFDGIRWFTQKSIVSDCAGSINGVDLLYSPLPELRPRHRMGRTRP